MLLPPPSLNKPEDASSIDVEIRLTTANTERDRLVVSTESPANDPFEREFPLLSTVENLEADEKAVPEPEAIDAVMRSVWNELG